VRRTEALVVGRYPELVRLAYLILPPTLERHRRVLAAHSLAQGSLPRRLREAPSGRAGTPAGDADAVRLRIVRGALRQGQSARRRSPLPRVWGLRLFPPTGGVEALAMEQAIGHLSAPGRAAFVLRVLDGLDDDAVRALLLAAGADDVSRARKEADALVARLAHEGAGADLAVERLLRTDQFDPCTLRASPSDLLRRRRRYRVCVLAVAGVTAAAGVAWSTTGARGPVERPAPLEAAPAAPVAGVEPQVVRAGAWNTTTRLDFGVWSTRGARVDDEALTGAAVAAWTGPDAGVTVALGPDAAPGAPSGAPRLLYAGDVAGASVVLLADGTRLARYTEENGARRLDVAVSDDSDARSSSAVVLRREPGGVHMLLAPWVTASAVRDLRRPDAASRPLASADGVTAAMPDLAAEGRGCAVVPVLELRSGRAADNRPYLLADLGGLTPAHLTYMPPPDHFHTGRPSEAASGTRALDVWSRTACALDTLRGRGLRLVNNWEFAHFALPGAPGEAMWSCMHAFDRTGGGEVVVQFLPPGAKATGAKTVTRLTDSPACSRPSNDIVAYTWWRSPAGTRYLVAAGTRDVVEVTASGSVTGSAAARRLVVKAPAGAPDAIAPPRVEARVVNGTSVEALT